MALNNFDQIVERAKKSLRKQRVVIAGADSENILLGAFEAQDAGFASLSLGGEPEKIEPMLERLGLKDKPYREQGTNYPEPRWAGPTPASGLYARHVDGLHLRNIHFRTQRPDYRHRVILDDVKNVDMEDLKGPVEKGAKEIVIVK